MEAYLDNSATTRVLTEVADRVYKIMTEDYGNPSSMHQKGLEAENIIRDSRQTLARLLKVTEKELVFTSGGTESDNLAIVGSALANCRRGKHMITTEIEHPAVLESFAYLESQGFEVTKVPVNAYGQVEPQVMKNALREDTILVSIMYVNNEIGAVNPIAELGKVIKAYHPEILFHVDGVQAFGKYRIHPLQAQIDLLSLSSHKIHGPKGVGLLYIKDRTKIRPLAFGGGQQKGIRPGTENVPGIAGMALASQLVYTTLEEDIARLYELKKWFVKAIHEIDGTTINGYEDQRSAPHIVSVSFEGIPKSEVLLHALEERGIYVSSGSACASNKPAISNTLKSIQVRQELLSSTLRFSFSKETTREELE